ncbi:MAG TPA: hypothetical protein VMU84_09390 [Thermoanaerobaculia bacterium]|nr:hypothetical protein [Thermoanaerobaculia bacterium]
MATHKRGTRKAPRPEVETQIFSDSARRCAICYVLDGDLGRKHGQVAHIDKDRTQSEEKNLVFLCLEHHNEYDGKTSQSKNITAGELREYKKRLTAAIVEGRHLLLPQTKAATEERIEAVRVHDVTLFRQADGLMPERLFLNMLDQLTSQNSFLAAHAEAVDHFRNFFSESGNQYITPELSERLLEFLDCIDALRSFMARHFFVYPRSQPNLEARQLCMHPELNTDRGGEATAYARQTYAKYQNELEELATIANNKWVVYRGAIKAELIV